MNAAGNSIAGKDDNAIGGGLSWVTKQGKIVCELVLLELGKVEWSFIMLWALHFLSSGEELAKNAEMEAEEDALLKGTEMAALADNMMKRETGWVITEFPLDENDKRRLHHHW